MNFHKETFDKFVNLIKDQFTYGGKKYALSNDNQRESTDVLFDKHGKNWLIGTIDKYTFRYFNLARERDLLKIATYMYLIWLKRGYFIMPYGVSTSIDTNLEIKELYFDKFINKFNEYLKDRLFFDAITLKFISDILGKWSEQDRFDRISSFDIYEIFNRTYLEWSEKFSDKAGQDTDTWLEEKEQK